MAMANSKNNNKNRDFLQHIEAYLSKRDGIDKFLKISRYSCKLILASSLLQSQDPASKSALIASRLKAFEASVGTSRKAFRLGKFVQDVNALRAAPSLTSREGFLELIAYTGEGIYYFVEQFVWLIKAGLLDKKHSKQLQIISAWAEFIGYFGSITLKTLQVSAMLEKETKLINSLRKSKDVDESTVLQGTNMLNETRQKRLLKTLSIIQDFSDAFLALSDIRDGKGVLSNPIILSSCGLLSALISTHKNWSSC